MATLSLTVFKAKQLSNGKHKIRIAVRHHHETCYIITPYIIDDVSQFKNGRIVKRYDADVMNMQLRDLLNRYQKTIDDIYNVECMSAKDLKNTIISYRYKDDNVTIGKICKDYIEELLEDKREGYAELIDRCVKYFIEFSKGDVPAKSVTPFTISNFERFLRNKKKLNQTTVGMYLTRLRVITNLGRKKYFVKQKTDPYQDFKIPQSLTRELDISITQFQRLKSYSPKKKRFIPELRWFCHAIRAVVD